MIKFYKSFVFILAFFALTSCDKDEEITKESDVKLITEFSIQNSSESIKASIDKYEINIIIPKGLDISSLTPTIKISAKSEIYPVSNLEQDFTNPVTYTVTAEDGSKQNYIVTVEIEKSKNCEISKFSFNQFDPVVTGQITNSTIELTVPIGTDLTKLVPTITISDDAIVSPKSEVEADLSKPVIYTVTAEDGTEQKYTVNVNIAKSSENKILEFKFEEFTPVLSGIIDDVNNTIKLVIPWAEKFDIYAMTPTIIISELASVNPETSEENSFKGSQEYTVTAEDNSTKTYTVTVEIEEAPTPTIEALTKTEYVADDEITIQGTNFSECQVYLKQASSSNMISLSEETITNVTFSIPNSTKAGEYELTIYIRDEEYSLGNITILPPAPSISNISTSSADDNLIVTIEGDNFSKGNNAVYFVMNNEEHKAYMKKDGDNSIQVILNPLLTPGSYNVIVKANGKEVRSNKTVEISTLTTTNPIITSVNKQNIKIGEKLIIDGKNLNGSNGQLSIIGDNGSIVRNVKIISDTQVEYVIPEELKAGTYEISIQMYFGWDLKFGNSLYNIVIED